MMVYPHDPRRGFIAPVDPIRQSSEEPAAVVSDPGYRRRDAQIASAESTLADAELHLATMHRSTRMLHEAISALLYVAPPLDLAQVIDEGLEVE